MFIRKDHSGHHNKWIINIFCLAIDFCCCFCFVFIIYLNLQLSTLADQIIWICFYTIQKIFKLYRYRKFFACSTLIINIGTVCLPAHGVTASGVSFIALYILDILQIGFVFYRTVTIAVFQPV